jgi:hypothetical protein
MARESIMALFGPALNLVQSTRCFSSVITSIIRSHAIIFTGNYLNTFDNTLSEINSHLDAHISQNTKEYLEQGYYIAISNCIALYGYGVEDNPLNILMKPVPSDQDIPNTSTDSSPHTFDIALRLFNLTTKIHVLRPGDTNTLPYLHVTLVFLRHIACYPRAELIFPTFPWRELARVLNALAIHRPKIAYTPDPVAVGIHPFPEDRAMRGFS